VFSEIGNAVIYNSNWYATMRRYNLAHSTINDAILALSSNAGPHQLEMLEGGEQEMI